MQTVEPWDKLAKKRRREAQKHAKREKEVAQVCNFKAEKSPLIIKKIMEYVLLSLLKNYHHGINFLVYIMNS